MIGQFIKLNQNEGTWLPGDEDAHEIEAFGDWTFNQIVERAEGLLRTQPEKQVYERLLGEVYPSPSGRVPKIVTTIVGKAIYAVQHS